MNKDEYEAAGLHMCDHCGRLYDSEIALVWCCNPRWDHNQYERHWERE